MDQVNNELVVSRSSIDNRKTEGDQNLVSQTKAGLAREVINTVSNIASVAGDCKTAKERTKQIEHWSNAMIVKTVQNNKTEQMRIEKEFRENESKLSALSKGLDFAISSGNPELITNAMRAISDIGAESHSKEVVSNLDNDPSQPLLDF